MAHTISGSLKTIAAQQLLFPQFHKRNGRSSKSLIQSELGVEVVRGKGYLLLSSKRSNSHVVIHSAPRRPRSRSKPQHVTYIPLVSTQRKHEEDSLESGFELMKRLSKIRRRHATESQWTEVIVPKRRAKLQISFALPSGSFFSEDSQDDEERPLSRLILQESSRKQPMTRPNSDLGNGQMQPRHSGGEVDVRQTIYKRRPADR